MVGAAVAPACNRRCLVAFVDVAVDVALAAAIAVAIAVAIAAAIAIAAHMWRALLLALPVLAEHLPWPHVEEAAPIHAHPVHFGVVLEVPEHRALNSEDLLAESSGGATPRATPKVSGKGDDWEVALPTPHPHPKNKKLLAPT